MRSRIESSRTRSNTDVEFPVIEFPDRDADLDSVDHPYAAAERVLSATS